MNLLASPFPCSLPAATTATVLLLLLLQQHLMLPSLGFASVALPTKTPLQRNTAVFTARRTVLAATPTPISTSTAESQQVQNEFSLQDNESDDLHDLQKIRAILEKRLSSGRGSLSAKEVEEINSSSSRILIQLQKTTTKEVPPVSTSSKITATTNTTTASTTSSTYSDFEDGPVVFTATDPMLDDQEGVCVYCNNMML
jgi:hypothetical protein